MFNWEDSVNPFYEQFVFQHMSHYIITKLKKDKVGVTYTIKTILIIHSMASSLWLILNYYQNYIFACNFPRAPASFFAQTCWPIFLILKVTRQWFSLLNKNANHSFAITKEIKTSSGTFLTWSQKWRAELWLKITGDAVISMACLMTLSETWEMSTSIPSLFISFTTFCKFQNLHDYNMLLLCSEQR